MDFLKVLDGLPLEQKQPFIDHFTKTLSGKPTSPLVMAQSLIVSNDLPKDKQIQLLIETLGLNPQSIDHQEYIQGIMAMLESKRRIKEMIWEHYNKPVIGGQRSKNDELIDLGKFLYTTDQNYKITPTEEPDFILEGPDISIGLEHSRFPAEKDKAFEEEILKKYLKPVLEQLSGINSSLKGVINITLNMDFPIIKGRALRDFKTKEIKNIRQEIHRTISNCIVAIISEKAIELPAFITRVSYQAGNEPLTIHHNQDFFGRTDFNELLIKAIEKKEVLLRKYKLQRNLKKWWLLLVFSDTNYSSSFNIAEHSINEPLFSSFDQVFILNTYDLACYELDQDKPNLRSVSKKQLKPIHTSHLPTDKSY